MKLPEPEGKIAYESDEYECVWISSQDAYTADQMRQVRIDTLEEAANAAHNCLNNYVFTAEMAGHAGYPSTKTHQEG